MKRILRHYAIDTFSLWVVGSVASGMIFEKGLQTLLFSGIALSAVFFFAKPVINLLLLPINLITFGLFRWVSSAVVLYLVTLIIKDFKIVFFNFSGFNSKWIDIPAINFEGALAFIAFSFILSFITSFLYWLMK
ncbi:phage holin family protein [Patescibacteria group bacterium]